jgi:tetratricopeptide (TPR) repeat protein
MRYELFKASHLLLPLLLVVTALCSFGLFSGRHALTGAEFKIRSVQAFHVTMRYRPVQDSRPEDGPSAIIVPLPTGIYPFQRIDNLAVYPRPLRIVTLRDGNRGAVFPLKSPACGGPDISVSFDATLFHVVFPVDLSSGRMYTPGPADYTGRLPWASEERSADSISRLAGRIAAGEKTSYYRAVRIYEYVQSHFAFRERPEPRSLGECLSDRELQCCDATLMFVSLCRSAGIPARFFSGLFISKDRFYYPQTHSWAQVFTDETGWIPVDVTLGRFDDRSRYLCLAEQRASYIRLWEGETRFVLPEDSCDSSRPCPVLLSMEVYPLSDESRLEGFDVAPVERMERRTIRSPVREARSARAGRLYEEALGLAGKADAGQAAALLEDAVKDSPTFSDAHRELIRLSFEGGRGEEITARYDRLMQQEPSPLSRYYTGLCRLHSGKYGDALKLFSECGQEGYASSGLYTSLGFLYLRTKQLREAERAFRRALGAEGDHFTAYCNLIVMFQDAEEWGTMLYWALEGMKEFPQCSIFRGQAGYGLIRLGRASEALGHIRKAQQMEPSVGWYHGLAGWAQRDLGQRESARRELDEALRLKSGISNLDYYMRMRSELE